MAQQHINLGTPPGGQDGDANRTAWGKAEANFNELYARGLPVGRNLLINPQFRINQRAFAGGALSAGAYGYDRWKAGPGGCSVAANSVTGVLTHASGSLVQVIEAPRLAGQLVTFSVADPSGPVGVSVDGVAGTITAGAGRRGVTLAVPVGSTGNVTLTITATGVTYKDPQLEVGDAATQFESRPLALETSLCQRYFEKSYNMGTAIGAANAGGAPSMYMTGLNEASHTGGIQVAFAVQKRATPAITVYSYANGAAGFLSDGTGTNCAATVIFGGEGGFFMYATNSVTTGPASTTVNMAGHFVADAEL